MAADAGDESVGDGSETRGGGADHTDAVGADDGLLVTDGLVKRFGELAAVDGVSISVPRGEFRSIIGPNGAGKTTFFNLVTGVMAPTAGAVYFDGADVTDLAPYERVRRGMGRSFQLTTVFGGLTVRENVRLAAQAAREGSVSSVDWLFRSREGLAGVGRVADEALARVGLADHAEERAAALAYGDRRRLEIGIVLATDPEFVLLDEPTAGMSHEETRQTMDLVDEELADKTLLLIEHDIDLVMDVSDRVTVLDRGAVLATGTPAEIAADESVQAAYLGGER
jgi:branched-chain amino acid transport system ATP-binding protein